jgi:hypothetical protein
MLERFVESFSLSLSLIESKVPNTVVDAASVLFRAVLESEAPHGSIQMYGVTRDANNQGAM